MIARFRVPSKRQIIPVIRSAASLSPFRYTTMAHPAVSQSVTIVSDSVNGHKSILSPEHPSLAIPQSEDDTEIRQKYRPFILDDAAEDWVGALELTTAMDLAAQELQNSSNRLKVLVLYGSLRRRSYSRLVALEASRILFRLGCDVRVFDPEGLPVKNDTEHNHPKVQELRELSKWSDGHVWVSPEQHGNLVSSFHLPFPFSLLTVYRPPSSRIKSTGFHCPPGVYVQPRAGPSLLRRFAAARNRSTP